MSSDYHTSYMLECLRLAKRGLGKTSPNPLVGAVIVRAGKVLGSGYHKRAGLPHAEINAIRQAKSSLKGSTLYVNLEPCCHWGKTPPCTQEIIKSGIDHVVLAHIDPNPEVSGRGIRDLKKSGIRVTVGVLEDEARRLNEVYIKYITKKRPFIILKAAMSLDGKIAIHGGRSKWITGPLARRETHRLRNMFDAVLVGKKTVERDNPHLDCRLLRKTRKDPLRIILDSRLSLPSNLNVFQYDPERTIVATTSLCSQKEIERLISCGVRVLVTDPVDGRTDLNALLSQLCKMEISSILVEGGQETFRGFLLNRLVDKAFLFYAPKIIGGDGLSSIGGLGFNSLDEVIRLKEVRLRRLADDFLVSGYIDYGK